MIAHLKTYPIVKDSGVVWLGDVPRGWDVLRGRQLFEIKKRVSGELGHPVISVTQQGLRVKDVESGGGQLSQDYSKYQTVGVGEFAMNSMDLLTGGVGIATSPGVTSPDYRVFAVRDKSACSDRYMLHVLRMLYRNRGFYAWGQGSAQFGRWRLPRRRFNDFPFPVPSFSEQVAIARFLDWANGRLERAIRAKRTVISLLNEQKQAIIYGAVTRGLNPSVALKPSGIPWLGDIPAHWRIERLKFLAHIKTGGRDTANRVDDAPYPFFVRSQTVERIGTYSFDGEAVLTAGDGAGVAKVFHYINGKFDYHQRVYKFSDFKQIDGRFFFLYLKATLRFEALDASAKSTVDSLRLPLLQNFPTVIPPIEEQRHIVRALDHETSGLDTAISRLEREIELLLEYRNRLVADVVTGKLDVREAARQLPEQAAEAAPLSELEHDPEEAAI